MLEYYDAFAYYIRGGQLALVKWDYDNGRYESPDETVENGLKIEYSKRRGFLKPDGGSAWEASTPLDESAVLDVPEYLELAVIKYVQAQLILMEDPNRYIFYMKEFRRLIGKHKDARVGEPRIAKVGRSGIK